MVSSVFNWFFGFMVFTIGLLNLFLIHPVPGLIYLFLSLVYFPPATSFLQAQFGIRIPLTVKIILAIVIFMFTLGVSDLGDMIDNF